jgi:PAS domain S-box-containing protein
VFTLTLLLTIAATAYVWESTRLRETVRFEAAARQLRAAIHDRIETSITLLRATSGLFAASQVVHGSEFRSFVERIGLRAHYPGIQGIGYSVRVRREAIDSLRRAMAAQGFADFRVWPADTASERHAIVYLIPPDRRNEAAYGYDMFTNAERREAMLRAWTTGAPAASGRVTLVQEIDEQKQAGFLIYVPVYRGAAVPATAEQRRAELVGFVYSPFRAGDLLGAVLGGSPSSLVDVWVYDGSEPGPAHLLYTSAEHGGAEPGPVPQLTLPLDVAGRPWTLVFAPRPGGVIGSGRDLPALVLVLGLLTSLVLVGIARTQARATARAELAARELQRSQEAVRASEERFRFLADFIPPLVWASRPDGTLEYVNRRCAEYFGVPEASVIADGWWRFVHPDDLSAAAARWNEAVRSGSTYDAEYRLRRADGAWRWHLDRGSPLRGEDRAIVRWFGTCTDVDDQRRAQEALREAQKLESIGVLAGGIAHDFNNLLTGIAGNASLARATLPPDHPAQPMLRDALQAGERAAGLTAQLLAYAGKGRFFLQVLDLPRLVRELTHLVRATIPRKVEIRLELAEACPRVFGDPSQLQQLVMNLVINGAEAVGEGVGTVTVRVRPVELTAERIEAEFARQGVEPGRYVRLEVVDTGCGMDEATLAHIFDPFFTTKFTGRGLGLAAALGIVRGHRGGIAIRTAPGQGSTFSVVLPTAPAPTGAAPPRESPPPRPSGAGLVLFADDEPAVRRVGQAALEAMGYEVVLAEDGAEALRTALEPDRPLRLAIVDLTLPQLGGAEVARRLRSARPGLPILVMSGYGEQEALVRLAGVHVDGFLPKPFTDHDLARVVAEVGRDGGAAEARGAP